MKIPIDIHVRSERIGTEIIRRGSGENKPETDDFVVSGIMKNTKNGLQIEYSEENGAVITTINVFKDGMVSINRIGGINSHMVFESGKSFLCICNTGFFPMQIRVRTNSLENTLSLDGGKLDIDYNVEIVGNLAEKNKLSFSVSPDISVLRS